MTVTTMRQVTLPGIDAIEETYNSPHMGAFMRGEISAGAWLSAAYKELRSILEAKNQNSRFKKCGSAIADLLCEDESAYDNLDEEDRLALYQSGFFAKVAYGNTAGSSFSEEFVRVFATLIGKEIPLNVPYEESIL